MQCRERGIKAKVNTALANIKGDLDKFKKGLTDIEVERLDHQRDFKMDDKTKSALNNAGHEKKGKIEKAIIADVEEALRGQGIYKAVGEIQRIAITVSQDLTEKATKDAVHISYKRLRQANATENKAVVKGMLDELEGHGNVPQKAKSSVGFTKP